MNAIKQLERRATKAHRDGVGWVTFWPTIADAVRAAAPFDRLAYQRLRGRLLHLLLTGETSGMYAIGDDDATPWLDDDSATVRRPVDDTTTRARFSPVCAGLTQSTSVAVSAVSAKLPFPPFLRTAVSAGYRFCRFREATVSVKSVSSRAPFL